jgi:hypothetical protein
MLHCCFIVREDPETHKNSEVQDLHHDRSNSTTSSCDDHMGSLETKTDIKFGSHDILYVGSWLPRYGRTSPDAVVGNLYTTAVRVITEVVATYVQKSRSGLTTIDQRFTPSRAVKD